MRRIVWKNREFLVTEGVIQRTGVFDHGGDRGEIFIGVETLRENSCTWPGKPIYHDHPSRGGSDTAIGLVGNTAFAAGELSAVVWFDVEWTRLVVPKILSTLLSGRPLGCSASSQVSSMEAVPGECFQIANGLQADHLAVFVQDRGVFRFKDCVGINLPT